MRFSKDVIVPILLATFYFLAVYFAVAALIPAIALQAGLVAVIIAMLAYLFLRVTSSDEAGMPMGLLILSPVICLTAGVIWWVLRLIGFWRN